MLYRALVLFFFASAAAHAGSCANPPNFFLCNLDYEPVTCTAWSYRNEPLSPPFEVKASNSCFADLIIDSKICGMGLDPEGMYLTDVTCRVEPHE